MDCGKCFFSKMIDVVLWCCVINEDLALDAEHRKYTPSINCEDYVNVEKLNEILKEYCLKLKAGVDDQLDEFIQERIDHFGG